MRLRIFLVITLLLPSSLVFSYQETKELSLPAEGIERLEVECGGGFLKVYGKEGIEEIEVTAEIVINGVSKKRMEEIIQKHLDLSLKKSGTRAVLKSQFKKYFSLFSWGERIINLSVLIPKQIHINIDDGSGFMHIEDIEGDVKIDDGSGEIIARKIGGNVDIDDGSGEIDVKYINGNVSIDDGSGSIYAKDIQGTVVVNDGSGSIDIDGVEKNVIIESDGSGSVNIRNVKGKIIK